MNKKQKLLFNDKIENIKDKLVTFIPGFVFTSADIQDYLDTLDNDIHLYITASKSRLVFQPTYVMDEEKMNLTNLRKLEKHEFILSPKVVKHVHKDEHAKWKRIVNEINLHLPINDVCSCDLNAEGLFMEVTVDYLSKFEINYIQENKDFDYHLFFAEEDHIKMKFSLL